MKKNVLLATVVIFVIAVFFLVIRNYFTDEEGKMVARSLPKYPPATSWKIASHWDESAGPITAITFNKDDVLSNQKFVAEYTKLLEKNGWKLYKENDLGGISGVYESERSLRFSNPAYQRCIFITEHKVMEGKFEEYRKSPYYDETNGILVTSCK